MDSSIRILYFLQLITNFYNSACPNPQNSNRGDRNSPRRKHALFLPGRILWIDRLFHRLCQPRGKGTGWFVPPHNGNAEYPMHREPFAAGRPRHFRQAGQRSGAKRREPLNGNPRRSKVHPPETRPLRTRFDGTPQRQRNRCRARRCSCVWHPGNPPSCPQKNGRATKGYGSPVQRYHRSKPPNRRRQTPTAPGHRKPPNGHRGHFRPFPPKRFC